MHTIAGTHRLSFFRAVHRFGVEESNYAQAPAQIPENEKEPTMNRFAIYAAFLLTTTIGFAQSNSTTPQASPTTTVSSASNASASGAEPSMLRGVFPVATTKTLDSKKLHEGDKIVCTSVALVRMANGLTIHSGAEVIGHVVQAQARSKGDAESSLAIQFDQIQLPNGKSISMKGVVQAVAPNPGGDSGPNTGAASPGTMPGPGGETLMPPGSNTAVAGPDSGVHPLNNRGAIPLLTSQSTGVLGLRNLEMDKNSVLTSSGKEVKLNQGIRILVRAE